MLTGTVRTRYKNYYCSIRSAIVFLTFTTSTLVSLLLRSYYKKNSYSTNGWLIDWVMSFQFRLINSFINNFATGVYGGSHSCIRQTSCCRRPDFQTFHFFFNVLTKVGAHRARVALEAPFFPPPASNGLWSPCVSNGRWRPFFSNGPWRPLCRPTVSAGPFCCAPLPTSNGPCFSFLFRVGGGIPGGVPARSPMFNHKAVSTVTIEPCLLQPLSRVYFNNKIVVTTLTTKSCLPQRSSHRGYFNTTITGSIVTEFRTHNLSVSKVQRSRRCRWSPGATGYSWRISLINCNNCLCSKTSL